jgi:predicted enzyme related to lactoylglutathione lyase
MGKPVIFFEYVSPKPQETISFYSSLFDWEIHHDEEQNYGVVQTGPDSTVMGGIGGAEQLGDQRVTVYAGVDDVQEYLDKAEKLGGKTVLPPTEMPGYGTIALFSDPAGQVTGLWKRP